MAQETDKDRGPGPVLGTWAPSYVKPEAAKLRREAMAVLAVEVEPTAQAMHRLWQVLDTHRVAPVATGFEIARPFHLVRLTMAMPSQEQQLLLLQGLRRIMAVRHAQFVLPSTIAVDQRSDDSPAASEASGNTASSFRAFLGRLRP